MHTSTLRPDCQISKRKTTSNSRQAAHVQAQKPAGSSRKQHQRPQGLEQHILSHHDKRPTLEKSNHAPMKLSNNREPIPSSSNQRPPTITANSRPTATEQQQHPDRLLPSQHKGPLPGRSYHQWLSMDRNNPDSATPSFPSPLFPIKDPWER